MVYTMTAFTNNSQTWMYVYQSDNGTDFTLLKAQAYRPFNPKPDCVPPQTEPDCIPLTAPTDEKGLCRDPSVFRHADGAYYLTYTTAWNGNTIGFARSTDRITWNYLYDYTFADDVHNAWAPEWFVDADRKVHVLVTLNTGSGFEPHIMTAEDASLRTWCAPAPLTFNPAPNTDPPELGYIDTTIKFAQHRYYAFVKNESTKFVELAVADAACGPYQIVRTDDWAGWGNPREGQCVIQLPDGRWRIYLDAYNLDDPLQGFYIYSDSFDNFATWTKPETLPGADVSGTVRHCTVLPEKLSSVPPPPGSPRATAAR